DDARAQITLTMQPGATIEQTDATTTKASDIIGKLQDVTHVFSSVGSASSGGCPDSSTTSSVGSATIVAGRQRQRHGRQDRRTP
ncbi:hypothetical protein ACC674_38430, partial [Rhizobium ruizarguesonis]